MNSPPQACEKISTEIKQPKSKKKSKNRCKFSGCRKKMTVTDWACKCGKKFCSNHKSSITHGCTFDWKMQQQDILKTDLGKGKSIDTKNFVGIC